MHCQQSPSDDDKIARLTRKAKSLACFGIALWPCSELGPGRGSLCIGRSIIVEVAGRDVVEYYVLSCRRSYLHQEEKLFAVRAVAASIKYGVESLRGNVSIDRRLDLPSPCRSQAPQPLSSRRGKGGRSTGSDRAADVLASRVGPMSRVREARARSSRGGM